MLSLRNPRILPQSHLINLLSELRDHQPAFTLFLGAGASIRSGVKPASVLINMWREKYASIHGADDPLAASKRNQPEGYSFLFEALFDHASQRRTFIETCIEGAEPSWGYIYLVNLIHSEVFNTVFTTNFDDLLNEACFAYSSSVRPVVCAHDSSISNVRIFSSRPKIIKLHGDFLFDSIKNTSSETSALERNMEEKFNQYANEFGMIVLGYSGNDRSVMDPLERLLDNERCFPNGVYWCVRKGTNLSRYVDRLLRFPRFKLVEVEGFDEFCADLHYALGLTMQPELQDPYGALTQKLDGLMRRMGLPETGSSHPVIEQDVARLAERLVSLAITTSSPTDQLPVANSSLPQLTGLTDKMPVPFVFLANFFLRRGQNSFAHICAACALQQEPTENAFDVAFRALRNQWDDKLSEYVLNRLKNTVGRMADSSFYVNEYALEMLNAKRFDAARELFELSYELEPEKNHYLQALADINAAQLYIHKGEPVPSDLLRKIVELSTEPYISVIRMGAAIVIGDWGLAEKMLGILIKNEPDLAAQIPTWPIFELLLPHIQDKDYTIVLGDIRKEYLSGRVISRTGQTGKLVSLRVIEHTSETSREASPSL